MDTSFPIFQFKDIIYSHIHQNRVTLIQAETGAGKSTLIGPLLLNYLYMYQNKDVTTCKILVCQPRRVNCIMLSNYVKTIVKPSIQTGYKVRFLDTCNNSTQVAFYTTGMLMSIILSPEENIQNNLSFLNNFDFIVLDEIHENSMDMTFFHYIFKEFLSLTKSQFPKLILMSATIQQQSDVILQYYSRCVKIQAIYIPGKLFDVSVYEQKLDVPFNDRMQIGLNIILSLYYSNILQNTTTIVFMPGEQEIKQLQNKFQSAISSNIQVQPQMINEYQRYIKENMTASVNYIQGEGQQLNYQINNNHSKDDKQKCTSVNNQPFFNYPVKIFSLYAQLPIQQQQQILNFNSNLSNQNVSMIIFATNILETSLTIKNCKIIVDLGLFKQMIYDNTLKVNVLKMQQINFNQFFQRKGRAGRLCNGQMFLAYKMDQIQKQIQTEIEISPLQEVVLRCLFINKLINQFKFENQVNKDLQSDYTNIDLLYAPPNMKNIANYNQYIQQTIIPGIQMQYAHESICSGIDLDLINLISSVQSIQQLVPIIKFVIVISVSQSMSLQNFELQDKQFTDDVQKYMYIFDDIIGTSVDIHAQTNNIQYIALTLTKLFERLFNRFYKQLLDKQSRQKYEQIFDSKCQQLKYLTYKQIQESFSYEMGTFPQPALYAKLLQAHYSQNIVQYDFNNQCYNNVATVQKKLLQNKSRKQNVFTQSNPDDSLEERLYLHPNSALFAVKPPRVLYLRALKTHKMYIQHCIPAPK